jgi:hypothetical protein
LVQNEALRCGGDTVDLRQNMAESSLRHMRNGLTAQQNRKGRLSLVCLSSGICLLEHGTRPTRIKIEVQQQKFRRKRAKINLPVNDWIGRIALQSRRFARPIAGRRKLHVDIGRYLTLERLKAHDAILDHARLQLTADMKSPAALPAHVKIGLKSLDRGDPALRGKNRPFGAVRANCHVQTGIRNGFDREQTGEMQSLGLGAGFWTAIARKWHCDHLSK